ncbi:hypothetical protein [Ureibacillus chungkukjangi]|uniref:hypothetical protein n=1 Tax=Ureibacillus chungkukjangi TaxID=1202712 RepID=UPI000D347E5C|nr:hypothetical protein [Ureibacillus chungkukjangi]MCM3389963.1 hypothetical protein [Ureibacillus chungkukjangi]
MEVKKLSKDKKNTLDREEYGHGYDLSPDDFDVIGQNDEAKRRHQNENKDKPDNKHNPSRLNL